MRRALVGLLLPLLFLACRRDPISRLEKDPQSLAVVGRFVVTRNDLSAALSYSQAGSTEDPWVLSRVWDELVDGVLVLNDLAPATAGEIPKPLGPISDPKAREVSVRGALQERVYARVEIPPADVAAYYREHEEEFQRGPGVLLREMLLPGPAQAADAETLLRRGHSFVDVARLYSLSPNRGAIQYFQFGELPDYLRPVIEKARSGSPTAPMRLAENSYQILLVQGRFDSYVLPLGEVAAEIRLRLSDERGERLKAAYLDGLRRRLRIVVFSSKLPFAYQEETP
jgi:hypothetical protein